MALTIGVAKETMPGETRVAIAPEVIRKLSKDGVRVVIETGAGAAAQMPDSDFVGAEIVADAAAVLQAADLLLTVQPPAPEIIAGLGAGKVVIGFMQPHRQAKMIRALCDKQVTSLAMELVPRISRAQSMDALSSQAAVAGYKAVIVGAAALAAVNARVRVDNIDDEMLAEMRRAGCKLIRLGVESGSQEVLNRIQKGLTLKQRKAL